MNDINFEDLFNFSNKINKEEQVEENVNPFEGLLSHQTNESNQNNKVICSNQGKNEFTFLDNQIDNFDREKVNKKINEVKEINNKVNNIAESVLETASSSIVASQVLNAVSNISKKDSIDSNSLGSSIMKLATSIDGSNDLKQVIKTRIPKLTNEYIFCQNYSDSLVNFFRKFNSILLAKVEYSLDFNKKFIQFFKNISQCYFRFAKDLEKSNELINISNNQGMILSGFVNKMLEQAQNQITSYFENFSSILNNKTVGIKEPKIKEFYARLSQIAKDIDSSIQVILKHKAAISKEFSSNKSLLDDLVKCINEKKSIDKIIAKNDFFFIEYKLNISYRIMNCLTKDFLLNYKEKILDLQVLILDYVTILKDNIDSYISENRKIFNESGFEENIKIINETKEKNDKSKKKVVKDQKEIQTESKNQKDNKDNKEEKKTVNSLTPPQRYLNFSEMQKHYDSLNKESVEQVFATKQIINYEEIDVDKEYLTTLNEILGEYQKNLLISSQNNIGNMEIKDYNKFKLENHSNVKQLLDFLILVNPMINENLNDYLKHDFIIKRENGLILEKWLFCRIVVTTQNNVFIYDLTNFNENTPEIKVPKLVEKLNYDSIKYLEKDSKKHPYRFSLTDSKKGIVFNSKLTFNFDAEEENVLEAIKKVFDKK